MKSIVTFLKKILLFFELIVAVAVINWEKTLFIGVIALDQISKIHILNSMEVGESIPIIEKFFYLCSTYPASLEIQTGYVIDFLDFKVWRAIFNVADVAIVVGMFIIFYFVAFRMDDNGNIKEARQ